MRLLSNSKRNGACLEWQGAPTLKGYGQISINNKPHRPHRIIYELVHGSIPSGECVAHLCDNPKCIEPDHLALATNQENLLDRDKKNRQARGSRQGHSILTEENVRHIKSSAATNQELAYKYSVSKSTIGKIRTGVNWRNSL